MPTAADIAAIDAASAKVASQSADGVSESNRSAADLIALQSYRRGLNATKPANAAALILGMCCKIVPPGAV